MIKNLQKELIELELLTAALLGFNAELEKKELSQAKQLLFLLLD